MKKVSALFHRRKKVYVEEWPAFAKASPGGPDSVDATEKEWSLPMVSGNWVPELVRLSGGEPFPLPPGALSREVTLEEAAAFDPDLIVISWCGAGALADPSLLLRRPEWDRLRAVREKSVRVIDDSLLNRPGPRLVEGARHLYGWLFELLH